MSKRKYVKILCFYEKLFLSPLLLFTKEVHISFSWLYRPNGFFTEVFVRRILLTGFEPFHLYKENPSADLARSLAGSKTTLDYEIVSCVLPVVRNHCFELVQQVIQEYKPLAVVALGQGGGTSIALERIAINIDDYRMEDNAGNKVLDTPIVEEAPIAYWSTLPIKKLKSRLERENIAVSISNSAGTFVCNHLFFQLQHWLLHSPIRSGFVHVPMLPIQNPKESMDWMHMRKAIFALLEELELFLQASNT